MAKNKDEGVSAGPLMYVGARRADPIPLETGNVFTILPAVLREAMDKDAALSALFVPLDETGKVGAALARERSKA